ncbi:MAG: DMT family transporter [Burkholderiaceae bacterium]|nr:DMT family transporter [Burkholderiaceae bacterium]
MGRAAPPPGTAGAAAVGAAGGGAAGGGDAARRALLVGTSSYMLASVFWGMNIPFTAVLFRSFDPFFMALLRVALATALLAVLVALRLGPRALAVPMRAVHFALMTLAMTGFFVFFNLALRYTNAITIAALMAGAPVYAAVTMRVAVGARLERGFVPAAALTLAGAAVTILGRAAETGERLRFEGGEPLIVLSLVCWALYSLGAQRWFAPGVAQLRRTYVSTLGATAWLALCWWLLRSGGMIGAPNLAPDAQAIGFLLATAVFSTALGGVAWNVGVNRIGLMAGSLWQNAVPVFAVFIAIAMDIRPSASQIAGGAIVMSGVLYMQWRKFREQRGPVLRPAR